MTSRIKRLGYGLVSCGALLWAATGAARADLVNVDISGQDVRNGDAPGSPYTLNAVARTDAATGGTAGSAASSGTWNNLPVTHTNSSATSSTNNPTSGGPFTTATGSPTGVTLTLGTTGADNLAPDNAAGDAGGRSNNGLYDDYIAVRGTGVAADPSGTAAATPNSTTFTIGGLTQGGTYDLYLYASPGQYTGNNSVFTITSQGGSPTATATNGGFLGTRDNNSQAADAPSNFVLNQNYVRFTGLTANGSGQITGTLAAGLSNSYGVLNGLQIVGSFPVPEPTALGVLGFAALPLLRRRR